MAKIGGRQVEVGIGIETTPGTAVSAADYFKWDSFSMQSVSEKTPLKSARGIRNETSNSIITMKYGKGSLEFMPSVDILPYVLGLTLGTRNSTTHSGETTVYDHTFTVQNANASMKTATMLVKQGGIQTERYANVVVDSFDLTVAKDLAKVKLGLLSGFPDTGSVTPAYTQDTLFSKVQMTLQFGSTLTAAASASILPVIDFSLTINNNVLTNDAFLSGSAAPVAGGFFAGKLTIKGSYSLQFGDTTGLAKYQANTKEALIVTLTGAAIGVVTSNEQIIFKLGRLMLNKPPLEYTIDGITTLKQEFDVEYDATDHEVTAIVTNTYVGTNYQ